MFQKSFRNLMVAAALSLPVVSLNVPSALADQRDFTIVNRSGRVIHELYVAPSGHDNWGKDVLGDGILNSGRQRLIYFTSTSSNCLYDISVVFADETELDDRQINLCEIETYTVR